ncbi:MAG: tRNA (adenosine(37)-N6)-threonylcarbamoyltransferase complex dimerization subunit type 1 TsaB, partial [Demequina sp.]
VILALDTSGAIAVAVVDGDRTLAHTNEFAPRGHAELLSPMVQECLATAGVTRADVTAVVVGTGPGPYTGLRVGLMTARMLAHAWQVPVRGVSSLDAMGAEHGGDVTVVTDARRKEVYWASYAHGQPLTAPQVTAPEDVAVHGEPVGRGAVLYGEHFPHARHADPDPAWLARVVTRRIGAGEQSFPTSPLYLRHPDVHQGPRV